MLDYKIYTFLALCKNMNYRVTAEQLNMTQPAVTNHIKQLEREYCCKLFEYKNRVLNKTLQAEKLESYALSANYNANCIKNDLSLNEIPTLKIGATKTIGQFLLNDKVSSLFSLGDIELTYIIDNTEVLLNKLRNGFLDFVFIEGYLNKDEFAFFNYKTDELVGICSKEHHFSGKYVNLEDIVTNRLILREEGSGTRQAFELILTENNLTINSFNNKIQTNSFNSIIDLVAKDVGISFVYKSIADVTSSSISSFRLKNVSVNHKFSCVHLKNVKTSEFLSHFLHEDT